MAVASPAVVEMPESNTLSQWISTSTVQHTHGFAGAMAFFIQRGDSHGIHSKTFSFYCPYILKGSLVISFC